MMLVDVEVARASQVEREAAVLRDLFQHVIEEPQAGGDRARAIARQIEVDMDVRFLRFAMHLRAQRLADDAPGNGWPGLVRTAPQAYLQALKAQILGKFHIRVAVADHVAACLVDGMGREKFLHHADLGFAAGTVLALEVRTDAHRFELDSLGTEKLQDESVSALEILLRKTRSSESVLIGDHDEREARRFELEQRRHHSGHEANLLQTVYLFVRRLLVQGAVAIQKQYSPAAQVGPTHMSVPGSSMSVLRTFISLPHGEAAHRSARGSRPRRAPNAPTRDGRASRGRSSRRPGCCA